MTALPFPLLDRASAPAEPPMSFMVCQLCARTDEELLKIWDRHSVATAELTCDVCLKSYKDVHYPEVSRGWIIDCMVPPDVIQRAHRARFLIRYDTLQDSAGLSNYTLFWRAEYHTAMAGVYEYKVHGMQMRGNPEQYGFPNAHRRYLGRSWRWEGGVLRPCEENILMS